MERAGLLAQGETGGEWRHLAKAGTARHGELGRILQLFCLFRLIFFKEFGAGEAEGRMEVTPHRGPQWGEPTGLSIPWVVWGGHGGTPPSLQPPGAEAAVGREERSG